jgi:hypothetical protein
MVHHTARRLSRRALPNKEAQGGPSPSSRTQKSHATVPVLTSLSKTLEGIPTRVLALTGVVTVLGVAFGILQGWPVWGHALLVVLLWAPALFLETRWAWRHYGWLALFFLLVVTQSGHLVEHVAQVTQIHVLQVPAPDARGIFGALDVEWVHVTWNTWVLVATILLVLRFRTNGWLWAALVIALWHETEHLYLIAKYISTGIEGDPGLLADGGAIGGGLPIARPDLHFFYNLVETLPLIGGFVYQLRNTYDAWLAKAFPHLPQEELVRATHLAKVEQRPPGHTIVKEGDLAESFHVVSRGEVEVLRSTALGAQRVATLSAGQFFGEVGLLYDVPRNASVLAKTQVELLTFDRPSFEELMASTKSDLGAGENTSALSDM